MSALIRFLLQQTRHHKLFVRIVFITFLVTLSSCALLLYYYNLTNTEKLLVEQTQKRQQVIVRAASQAIQEHVKMYADQVRALTTVRDVANLDKARTREVFREVIQTHLNDPSFGGFSRIDNRGMAVVIENKERIPGAEGADFSYRDYFLWAKDVKNKNRVYISDVIIPEVGTNKGMPLIIIAAPTYTAEGAFSGVVLTGIRLEPFNETYVAPLSFTKSSDTWILDKNGRVIVGMRGLLGKNLFSYAHEKRWQGQLEFLNILKTMLQGDKGIARYTFQEPTGPAHVDLVAYQAIAIDDSTTWKLVLGVDEQDILVTISNAYTSKIIPLLSVIATIVLGFAFVILEKVAWRDGYRLGHAAGMRQDGK